MLKKLLQRIAIEFSFLFKNTQPNYPFNPQHRILDKKYEDIDLYIDFYQSARKRLDICTEKEIRFQDYLKPGSKSISVKRKLLNPLIDYHSKGLLQTQILLYKISYLGFSALTEFHFFENKLFCIECNLGNLSNVERVELLDEIKGYYNIDLADTETWKITDAHDSIVYIYNLDEFKIIFADTGNTFFKELENIEIFYNKRESSKQKPQQSISFTNIEEKRIEKIKGT
jgi:hypothetical protein